MFRQSIKQQHGYFEADGSFGKLIYNYDDDSLMVFMYSKVGDACEVTGLALKAISYEPKFDVVALQEKRCSPVYFKTARRFYVDQTAGYVFDLYFQVLTNTNTGIGWHLGLGSLKPDESNCDLYTENQSHRYNCKTALLESRRRLVESRRRLGSKSVTTMGSMAAASSRCDTIDEHSEWVIDVGSHIKLISMANKNKFYEAVTGAFLVPQETALATKYQNCRFRL